MNKDYLLKLSEDFNCEYEIGLTSEINDFLERQDNVKEFVLKYEEKIFDLTIKLKEHGLIESKLIFTSLVCFIEYTSTFYVREEYDNYIEYFLLSSMKDKKAFLCRVTFK